MNVYQCATVIFAASFLAVPHDSFPGGLFVLCTRPWASAAVAPVAASAAGSDDPPYRTSTGDLSMGNGGGGGGGEGVNGGGNGGGGGLHSDSFDKGTAGRPIIKRRRTNSENQKTSEAGGSCEQLTERFNELTPHDLPSGRVFTKTYATRFVVEYSRVLQLLPQYEPIIGFSSAHEPVESVVLNDPPARDATPESSRAWTWRASRAAFPRRNASSSPRASTPTLKRFQEPGSGLTLSSVTSLFCFFVQGECVRVLTVCSYPYTLAASSLLVRHGVCCSAQLPAITAESLG